jgi:outer membrane protein insertion porin family
MVGADLFARQTQASNYYSYENETYGGGLRAGFQMTEELALQARYNIYRQEISLPWNLNNCIYSPNALTNPVTLQPNPGAPGVSQASEAALAAAGGFNCYSDNEASMAVRQELASGPVWVSLVGYTAVYSTLDNNRNPTSGLYLEFKQDFAGVGGDVNFIRSTGSARSYYEVMSDVIAILHLQGGHIAGWGDKPLRMLDHFQMGPNLVRGFEPAGIGPRDMSSLAQDALGGSMYWGASIEAQSPIPFVPRDVGVKAAVFADAGSLWDYKGPQFWAQTGERVSGCTTTICPIETGMNVRASVGASLIWNSPFGPLRFDYAVPVLKQSQDRIQEFRFGGGTRF